MCKALEKFINLKTYPYFPKETFVERVKIRLNLIKKGHSLEFVNKEVKLTESTASDFVNYNTPYTISQL